MSDEIEATRPLLVDNTDGVLWLTLNRPEVRNALNRPLCEAIIQALLKAELDPSVRVVVLTGAGKAFCAGDDITGLRDGHEGRSSASSVPSDPLDGVTLYTRIASMIVALAKPVIVGINGSTAGAGLEIACAADLRYASSVARMGSGLVKIGQPGNLAMFPRVVGDARATEIFITGRLVNAEEALRIGLVHEVFDAATFEVQLHEIASRVAQSATKAIGFFKHQREANRLLDAQAALLAQDRMHRRAALEIRDCIDGAVAFLEKRPPRFTGQ